MPLDALTIAALRQDLGRRILQARIEKIFQPNRGDLLFLLRKGAMQYRLYFSSDTPNAWLGLIASAPDNPPSAPAFCMLLRKYLAGGRIIALTQPPFERLLDLTVEHYDEAEGLAERILHFEFMGRRGNAILTDRDGRILDALWRTAEESKRPLEPGALYQPPSAAGRLNPADLAPGTFANLLTRAPAGEPLAKLLQAKLLGLSPSAIAGLLERADLQPAQEAASLSREAGERLWAALADLMERVQAGAFQPHLIIEVDGKLLDVVPFPIPAPPGARLESVSSLAEAVGNVYGRAARERHLGAIRSSLTARVRKEAAKVERKRQKQETELTAAGEADLHRAQGETLLAHLAEVPKGLREVELPSLTEPGAVVKIVLDPSLSASANAQACFRRYQRARRGRTAIAAQLAKTGEELAYLKGLAYYLAAAESEAELAEIAAEMAAEGLLPKEKKQTTKPPGPHQYVSRDGLAILVGRNSRQNEHVTFKLAEPGDTWLHVREIPGAHVIVKNRGGRLSADTLLDAANLAVHFSQARTGSKVPVDYTERRHVRKRPGGRPGLVHYTHFQTVIVDPAPEILARLLET